MTPSQTKLSFEDVDQLKTEWQRLQPLKPDEEARLWKKLRLEWNYHSNHIEGNTLTYGETELLLIHDRTTGNHSHREVLEMKAHDVAVDHVRELADQNAHRLTEADVRDLNRIILKEPFWKEAQTPDGRPTRKQVIPGQYKTTPNNVLLPDGSTFFFASVEDTPPKMEALVQELSRKMEGQDANVHPIELAAKLHHSFVLIHPFDDGNGRVARLLTNYILMRCGYLPVVVRTEDKVGYLTALRLADAGDLIPLVHYILNLAEKSLRLGIACALGQSIEEPSDVEKELSIFIRSQSAYQDRVQRRSPEIVRNLFELGLKALIEKVCEKLEKLSPLFATIDVITRPKRSDNRKPVETFEALIPNVDTKSDWRLEFHFKGFNGQAKEPFHISAELLIHFGEFEYSIQPGYSVPKRLYSEPILPDEAEAIANGMLTKAFAEVKKKLPQQ